MTGLDQTKGQTQDPTRNAYIYRKREISKAAWTLAGLASRQKQFMGLMRVHNHPAVYVAALI